MNVFYVDAINEGVEPSDTESHRNLTADPSRETMAQQPEYTTTWEDMGLKRNLLKGLVHNNYLNPSPIQQQAIVPIIQGRDILVQSQSGTGKTATFGVGSLQLVDEKLQEVQVLIISPTRELAQQSSQIMRELSEFMGVQVRCCIGGVKESDDVRHIRQGCHVVSGTPGRLISLLTRQIISTSTVRVVVLDEVDELLSRGFQAQIYDIHKHLTADGGKKQFVLVSATLPADVVEVADYILTDPLRILLPRDEISLEGIREYFVLFDTPTVEAKVEKVKEIYGNMLVTQSIIFCNQKTTLQVVCEKLTSEGFSAGVISSDMKQEDREQAALDFKTGKTRVLIATDIFARGLNIVNTNVVINFDFPQNRETYIHRIGRSGRYGREGCAISFIAPTEVGLLKDVESFYRTQIDELEYAT